MIMNQSENAKNKMYTDIEEGENQFKRLLNQFGDDGMIYLERGRAYEYHEFFDKAAHDYKFALSLFPMQSWKETASNHLSRVEQKIAERNKNKKR